jgi:hypothetical protein
MNKQDCFKSLLIETERAYNQSSLKHKGWFYSICGTPIQPWRGIILGINWGSDRNYQHTPQSQMEFDQEIRKYKFIKASESFLREYLDVNIERLHFNYSNLCFFRTPREKDLKLGDYFLSIRLFKHYVACINPPWIFSFGITNFNRLKRIGEANEGEFKKLSAPNNKYFGVSGKLWDIPFFAVPHPNARIPKESRSMIWQKISSEIKGKDLLARP